MARTANTGATTMVRASELHAHDVIIGEGGRELRVKRATGRDARTISVYGQRSWTVASDRPVRVRTEHECDCRGSGIFHGKGYVENGVFKGYTGTHFACNGKGWQDRRDVIRNATYWTKYARLQLV